MSGVSRETKMNKVLVTGANGYIGSHICKALKDQGFYVLGLDNFSRSEKILPMFWDRIVRGDILDNKGLSVCFANYKPDAVIHCAGYAYIEESFKDPLAYYWNNVAGTISLLIYMQAAGVRNLIFSSSCSIYDERGSMPLTEYADQCPISPYARTKAMVEQILADCAAQGWLRYVSLRYFNATGADPDGKLGECHDPETHIIPLAIEAAALGQPIILNGDDYGTPDGTAIRDYVHVSDLASAHVLALKRLLDGNESAPTLNLGSGKGYSIREVFNLVERVVGKPTPYIVGPRRQGDATRLVADNTRAKLELGWAPQYGLEDMVRHAYAWRQKRQREAHA